MLLFLKGSLVKILMVSSRGILVKRNLTLNLAKSCSIVSLAKLNKSLNLHWLVVSDSEKCTKNFESVHVKRKAIQTFLSPLQEPYIFLDLVPTGSKSLRVFYLTCS